jgi:hypothetical protein
VRQTEESVANVFRRKRHVKDVLDHGVSSPKSPKAVALLDVPKNSTDDTLCVKLSALSHWEADTVKCSAPRLKADILVHKSLCTTGSV